MKKIVNKQTIDYNEELYTVTLIGDNCTKNTIEGRISLIEILKAVVNDPNLILVDTLTPDEMDIKYDGEKWVVKAKVIKYGEATEGRRIKGVT